MSEVSIIIELSSDQFIGISINFRPQSNQQEAMYIAIEKFSRNFHQV